MAKPYKLVKGEFNGEYIVVERQSYAEIGRVDKIVSFGITGWTAWVGPVKIPSTNNAGRWNTRLEAADAIYASTLACFDTET